LAEVIKEKEDLQNFSNIERPRTRKLSHPTKTRPRRKSGKSSQPSDDAAVVAKEEQLDENPVPVVEVSAKPVAISGGVSMFGGLDPSHVKLRSPGVASSHASVFEKEPVKTFSVDELQLRKVDLASKPKLIFKKEESPKPELVKKESNPTEPDTKTESGKPNVASRFGKPAEPEKKKEFGLKTPLAPAKLATASSKATSAPVLSDSHVKSPVTPTASAKASPEEAEVRKWIETTLKDNAVFQVTADLKSALKDGIVLCRLANKLRTDKKEIKINMGKFGASQLENINNYLKCVSEVFKVPATQSFTPNDLYEGQNIDKVLKHLLALKKALNK